MRRKTDQVKADGYQHSSGQLGAREKKLDLNDLLRRAKDEQKIDKKYNTLILSGAASVVVVFILLLSL